MSEEILLNELQLITAMYDPSDVTFHDPEVLKLVENCIPISDSVSLTLRLNEYVQLDIRLPLGYPETERLSAHCRLADYRTSKLEGGAATTRVKQWESQFNKDLSQNYLLKGVTSGDGGGGEEEGGTGGRDDDHPNILGLIQWLNDQFDLNPIPAEYTTESPNSTSTSTSGLVDEGQEGSLHKQRVKTSSPSPSPSCRIWIYSHHIYNKHKRKFLVNTARELGLAGFAHPGKPGFICVEGDPSNCDEYWSRVRQLTWQKISLIERQSFPESEIIFENKPFEEMHCDKSAFIRFLEEKKVSSIIKDYLGI